MRTLLIEDDATLGEAVRDHIAALGHAVDWACTLSEADDHSAAQDYELIVLDLGLPDGRGIDFLRRLRRARRTVPVIIVTAVDEIARRIEGLNSGADDYLVKPFDLAELTARIGAVLRRTAGNPNPLVRLGEVEIDVASRHVNGPEGVVDLSAREWAVLERLMRRPGAVVGKSEIEDSLYEFGAEVESNAVEVYVSRLRKKLGREAIVTLRGAGYRVGTPAR